MYITKHGLVFFLGIAVPVATFGAIQLVRRVRGYGDLDDPRNKIAEAVRRAWNSAPVR